MFEQAFSFDPQAWLLRERPDDPVFFFRPDVLAKTAARFRAGFPGEVTYAVKANPDLAVIESLVAAGITSFDVASPAEMAVVRAACPGAILHYHNPVRSPHEIAQAQRFGVSSWSVDRVAELDKLGDIRGAEIAVRLKLPVRGAAYDFGSKFGADPEMAGALLQRVEARGGRPSLTFHPGTQCADPEAWARYVTASAGLAAQAGIRLRRLNVGGGFAAHRAGDAPDLEAIFAAISDTARAAFGAQAPGLVCEPGRAMVAEAVQLALRVKAVDGDTVFLNDGIYGGLAEWRDMVAGDRIRVISTTGQARRARLRARIVFGPTCDSLDRLPDPLDLPGDIAPDDYVLFAAMGAYARAITTGFNGYGARRVVTLARAVSGQPGHAR